MIDFNKKMQGVNLYVIWTDKEEKYLLVANSLEQAFELFKMQFPNSTNIRGERIFFKMEIGDFKSISDLNI